LPKGAKLPKTKEEVDKARKYRQFKEKQAQEAKNQMLKTGAKEDIAAATEAERQAEEARNYHLAGSENVYGKFSGAVETLHRGPRKSPHYPPDDDGMNAQAGREMWAFFWRKQVEGMNRFGQHCMRTGHWTDPRTANFDPDTFDSYAGEVAPLTPHELMEGLILKPLDEGTGAPPEMVVISGSGPDDAPQDLVMPGFKMKLDPILLKRQKTLEYLSNVLNPDDPEHLISSVGWAQCNDERQQDDEKGCCPCPKKEGVRE
jgi:hypothetical protein